MAYSIHIQDSINKRITRSVPQQALLVSRHKAESWFRFILCFTPEDIQGTPDYDASLRAGE